MKKEETPEEEKKVYYDLYAVREGKRTVAVERQSVLTFVSTDDLVQMQLKKDLLKEIQMYWIADRRLWSKTREMVLALPMDKFDEIWSKVRWWTINIHQPELTPPLDEFLNNPQLPTNEICGRQLHWNRLIDPDKMTSASDETLDALRKLRDKEISTLSSH